MVSAGGGGEVGVVAGAAGAPHATKTASKATNTLLKIIGRLNTLLVILPNLLLLSGKPPDFE
jgi:hypothetical protein